MEFRMHQDRWGKYHPCYMTEKTEKRWRRKEKINGIYRHSVISIYFYPLSFIITHPKMFNEATVRNEYKPLQDKEEPARKEHVMHKPADGNQVHYRGDISYRDLTRPYLGGGKYGEKDPRIFK